MRWIVWMLLLTVAVGHADTVQEIDAAVALTERDKQVLGNVKDGTRTVEEAGFYLMMTKVADLPSLVGEEWQRLDGPAPENLIKRTDRYRYMPLRFQMRVYRIYALSVAKGTITGGPYWPPERPIYAIHGETAPPKGQPGVALPIVVFSGELPEDLPEPSLVDGSVTEYDQGPAYRVAGVFYKLIEELDTGVTDDDGRTLHNLRRYPVLLAWQWEPQRASLPQTGANQVLSGIVILSVLLGVAIFILLKRRTKQYKKNAPITFGDYEPLRDLLASEDENIDPVDPKLVRAVAEATGQGPHKKDTDRENTHE
jgi:LPXTG-motif cell wall-anchored protein